MRTFLKNVLLTAAVLTAAAISYRACHDESDGPINPADRGGVASIHPEEMREQRLRSGREERCFAVVGGTARWVHGRPQPSL
jgi:hypothetical protein